jgi:alkylation response protein AidB-like acyl-CoA dehydrogenase
MTGERIAGEDLELFERSLRHACESLRGEALDAALVELGWHDALAVDRRTAVSVLFEVQGRTGATSGALDAVLATTLGAPDPTTTAVVLPPLGRTAPPGGTAVWGLGTSYLGRAEAVLVAADGVTVVEAKHLSVRAVEGLDPDLGLVEVTADAVEGSDAMALGGAWDEAVAVGQLALAHELVGASRTMLELARQHAVERVQFGQPIARFQAVRHRLAEAHVAIESAADATEAAWDDGTPLAAGVAKAIAGRSARLVAKHCQQVLAGIGFTTEHPFHRHMRRALVLDRLLGDSKSLTKALGEELLRTGRLPPMLPL